MTIDNLLNNVWEFNYDAELNEGSEIFFAATSTTEHPETERGMYFDVLPDDQIVAYIDEHSENYLFPDDTEVEVEDDEYVIRNERTVIRFKMFQLVEKLVTVEELLKKVNP